MEVYPQADRDGLDSYLETQKEANLGLLPTLRPTRWKKSSDR